VYAVRSGIRHALVTAMTKTTRTYTLVGPDGKSYQSQTPGTLGGNQRGKLYGQFDCRAALRATARGGYVKYCVFFADEQTAIAAGYRPCAVCLPEKYKAWKANQAGQTA
jgi:metal binding Ada-like protein